jgi:hypothetical protein
VSGRRPRIAAAAGVIAAAACATPRAVAAPESIPAGLTAGWNRVPGGRGTGCATGGEFAFFVRPGDPRKLFVYFQGGGACSNARACDARGKPTFDPRVDSTDAPQRGGGLLDLADARNPVADRTILYVPYCTGDVHLGDRDTTYAPGVRIRHNGAANAAAALTWLFARYPAVETALVAGGSAGAIPSPVFAARVARRYPRARVVQLGDGAGGYRGAGVTTTLAAWGATTALRRDDPAFRQADSATLTFETLYALAARSAPGVRFAQINSADDETQRFFLEEGGVRGDSLPFLIGRNLADVRRDVPAFRTFTAPGRQHTVLTRRGLYTLAVDDVPLYQWVAALVRGDAVDDVGARYLPATAP